MTHFNNNLDKGNVLMQQALKKYAEGDFAGGDKDRQEANKFFDSMSKFMQSEEGELSNLYGESRNFGIAYNVFEQNINNLFETKEGKKIIKEAYDLIKNDKVLSEQFNVYDLFERKKASDNTQQFVNEAINMLGDFDRKQVKESNEKFIKFIRENKLNEYVEIPEELENLYESIEYIILNKKTFGNLNEHIKAKNIIISHINNNKELNEDKKLSFDDFKNEIDKLQENTDKEINEDELKLLKDFVDNKENPKKVFESYKRNAIKFIKTLMNENKDDERFSQLLEKINNKEYSDVLSENISNCAEMLEVCDIFKKEN